MHVPDTAWFDHLVKVVVIFLHCNGIKYGLMNSTFIQSVLIYFCCSFNVQIVLNLLRRSSGAPSRFLSLFDLFLFIYFLVFWSILAIPGFTFSFSYLCSGIGSFLRVMVPVNRGKVFASQDLGIRCLKICFIISEKLKVSLKSKNQKPYRKIWIWSKIKNFF